MRFGLSSSFIAHLIVLALAQFGLPGSCSRPDVTADYVPVELISAAQLVALMRQPEAPEEPAEIVVAPVEPLPPEPPETVEVPAPPELQPEPEPPEIVEVPPPEPPLEPELVVPPETPPEPELAEAPEPLPDIRPEARPEAPPRPEEVAVAEDIQDGAEDPEILCDYICELASQDPEDLPLVVPDEDGQVASLPQSQATRSAIEALKRSIINQISRCWAPPIGSPASEELSVRVRVQLNPEGGVVNVSVVDQDRMNEPYYRAHAEAAVRAVLNNRCNPLTLPAEQFDDWENIQFTFNPAEMLG